jgi:hypothetical protein
MVKVQATSISSFLRRFTAFCDFNHRSRDLELQGKSDPEILGRWHEALNSLTAFYQQDWECEWVARALADPYFPISKLRKLNAEEFATEPGFVNLSQESLTGIVAEHLLKWAEIFLAIREELEWFNENGLVSAMRLPVSPQEVFPKTGWCEHCGGCCEIRGGSPEFTATFELPGSWQLYFGGEGCRSQRFCPFLFEYFATDRYFCSIYQIKPKCCWEFDREECEFLQNDVARERASRLSWEA